MQIAVGGNHITDLHFVEPLRKKIQSLNKNNQCVVPGCKQKPAHSHVIPESVLALLRDEQGKVLTWEYSDEEVFIHQIRGGTWDQLFRKPKRIGTSRDATYPIFCSPHDNDIFMPLEKPGYDYEPEQAALLAYRALCSKTWNPHSGEKLDFQLASLDPQKAQEYRRFFSFNTMLTARNRLESMVQSKDYRELRWIKRVLELNPCIACTDAFVPYNGMEDAGQVASGKILFVPEDYVTFTLYPDAKLRASVCIVTCFKNNKRGEDFIGDLNPDDSSHDDVFDIIFRYALSMSLVYTSQIFWDFLDSEYPDYKEEYVKLRMSRMSMGANSQN